MNRRSFFKYVTGFIGGVVAAFAPGKKGLAVADIKKVRDIHLSDSEEFLAGVVLGLEIEADETIAKMKGISYEQWMAIKDREEARVDAICAAAQERNTRQNKADGWYTGQAK